MPVVACTGSVAIPNPYIDITDMLYIYSGSSKPAQSTPESCGDPSLPCTLFPSSGRPASGHPSHLAGT